MLENQAKGWHGSYSVAGRNSAEKYHIIVHKDEILADAHKKIHIKDIFTPNQPSRADFLEDNLDVFKVYSTESNEKRKSNKYSTQLKKSDMPDRLKYHNKTKQEWKKKIRMPPLVRYYPNYEYIWNKTITGPKWKKMEGRKPKKIEPDEKEFYILQKPIGVTGKSFIQMNKQTRRGEFININPDVRIRTDKSFEPDSEKRCVTADNINLRRSSPFDSNNNTTPNDQTQSITQNGGDFLVMNTNPNKINNYRSKIPKPQSKMMIQAPDFKKTISREQLEKIKGVKPFNIQMRYPDISVIKERPLSMVSYEQKYHNHNRNKQMQGMDPSVTFDPDKVISKVNNHFTQAPPNFDMIPSRPNNAGPLPSYMQKMHNRAAVYIMTDKSLKQNNFSKGKFMSATSTFWPKKSYNRLINLNLLQSKQYQEQQKKIEDGKEVQESRPFYNTNFDQILKEGELNRFDNITYKTIHRQHKIDPNDMEKFLLNFNNVDA